MKILTAREALNYTKESKSSGFNFPRRYAFDLIENAAQCGKTSCQVWGVMLFEEDWKYFESLGYTVDKKYNAIYWNLK